MDEATDPEKIAQQAKEHITGAAEKLKETASPIADATRRAAETAWNDANSEVSRLHSICEGYVEGEADSDALGTVCDRRLSWPTRARIR
jgi:hypothetical protein